MKRHYYYLVAGLQDITLDIHKLILDQEAFKDTLKTELQKSDFKLVEKLFLPFDNANLLNLLQKKDKPFNGKGNFSRELLEENIKEPASLPAYMNRFIVAFKNKEPIFPEKSPENELTTLFYDDMLRLENDFLRHWFLFDLTVKNVLTAMAARKYKLDYENQIIGTGERSEAIKKSHSRDFGLGSDIDYLEDLVNLARTEDLQEKEKAIDQFKWDYLDEETFFEYFTVERILAYVIKLGMVERWLAIDKEHGSELFKKLLKELQDSYQLPESFTEK
ncbi:MAG: DUF2764 family protein [Bacteroidales bacterium]